MKHDALSLKTIIEYCDNIIDNLSYYGKDEELFMKDARFQHSCSFCLFQIGENVKKLSNSLKENNPQVNWKEIAGLRDVIGHAYGGIDLESIWFGITEEVPVLKEECIKILRKIE